MPGWAKKMVDMARTPEEMDAPKVVMATDSAPKPYYPYGLCISLDQDDLKKLDLDDDVEAGDMIHLVAFAKVSSVNKTDNNGVCTCRVELQIQSLAVEDENDEETPSAKAARRYGAADDDED